MKEKIYITGHRNPDTDSICATLAYSYLMEHRTEYDVQPIRLGEINRETQFVLNYFQVDPPRFKDSIKPQVRDLRMDKGITIASSLSLYKAMKIISETGIGNLPVVDEEENLIGIVSLSDITRSYMDIWDDGILGRSKTSIENILEVLSGQLLTSVKKVKPFDGKIAVYAMNPIEAGEQIQEGDIIIIGNREDAQRDAIERGVSLIILTGGFPMSEELLKMANEKNVMVLSTDFNSYMAARLLPQSVPVGFVMSTEDLVFFHLDDTVDEAQSIMSKSRYRSYPVMDHQNKVVGSISRYHLITNDKKKLVLVDHNEKSQSIADIESAEIIEIIDHHRVANISTEGPVYFRNEPVGSTSTIIARIFMERGLRPPKRIAGLLASAIISDTLYFRSPTTTKYDKRALETMAKIAGIDPETYAYQMFKAGTSLENIQPEELLNSDVKEFLVEEDPIRVAQVFTMDLENLASIKAELLEKMEEIRQKKGNTTFILILTDIFKERSEVMVKGSYGDKLAATFEQELSENSFVAEGLLSRKKQMLPNIHQVVIASKS